MFRNAFIACTLLVLMFPLPNFSQSSPSPSPGTSPAPVSSPSPSPLPSASPSNTTATVTAGFVEMMHSYEDIDWKSEVQSYEDVARIRSYLLQVISPLLTEYRNSGSEMSTANQRIFRRALAELGHFSQTNANQLDASVKSLYISLASVLEPSSARFRSRLHEELYYSYLSSLRNSATVDSAELLMEAIDQEFKDRSQKSAQYLGELISGDSNWTPTGTRSRTQIYQPNLEKLATTLHTQKNFSLLLESILNKLNSLKRPLGASESGLKELILSRLGA